jgi:hypothetical protein
MKSKGVSLILAKQMQKPVVLSTFGILRGVEEPTTQTKINILWIFLLKEIYTFL